MRPHHFQQAENYLEGYMRNWGQPTAAVSGVSSPGSGPNAAAPGKIALNAASGIMPDGTPFRFAGAQQAPAPLTIAETRPAKTWCWPADLPRAGVKT
ncbi:type VI secretion system baseplate subunit TssK [Serratia ureilytica]